MAEQNELTKDISLDQVKAFSKHMLEAAETYCNNEGITNRRAFAWAVHYYVATKYMETDRQCFGPAIEAMKPSLGLAMLIAKFWEQKDAK